MIEASFEAVIPKAINAEFEAIIPREKAFDIVNKDIHIDTNGRYEVKADAGTAMTQVNVEVDIQPKEYKDVNFFDYDGTILFSYTWKEAEKLTEMPTPPANLHKGLLFEGWNYTLEEMKAQGDYADIGALYTTDNGSTRIQIVAENNTVYLSYSQSVENGTTILWGDGQVTTAIGTDVKLSHKYNNLKNATIEIQAIDGCQITLQRVPVYTLEINAGKNLKINRLFDRANTLKKISVNTTTKFATIFANSMPLVFFVIPRATIDTIHLLQVSQVKGISLPSGIALSTNTFYNVDTLSKLTIPISTMKSFDPNFIRYLYNATTLRIAKNCPTLPFEVINNTIIVDNKVIKASYNTELYEGITSIGEYAFYYSKKEDINIPSSVTNIGKSAFYNSNFVEIVAKNVVGEVNQAFRACPFLKKVVLGDIDKISNYCFYTSSQLELLDLRKCTKIPLLDNTNALGSINNYFKIVVPDALYDEWIVATNWATYASRIVKASEFVEPTNN